MSTPAQRPTFGQWLARLSDWVNSDTLAAFADELRELYETGASVHVASIHARGFWGAPQIAPPETFGAAPVTFSTDAEGWRFDPVTPGERDCA